MMTERPKVGDRFKMASGYVFTITEEGEHDMFHVEYENTPEKRTDVMPLNYILSCTKL